MKPMQKSEWEFKQLSNGRDANIVPGSIQSRLQNQHINRDREEILRFFQGPIELIGGSLFGLNINSDDDDEDEYFSADNDEYFGNEFADMGISYYGSDDSDSDY
jgi:hypothetical protein